MNNTILETEFNFNNQTSFYKGKVRDVYTINNDLLIMIASDRISAFDHVLPQGIPFKGQVLNQIASIFLDATSDIVPNWKLATPDPSVTIGKKCDPFMVEMVIRGYLTGHAWREYKSGKRIFEDSKKEWELDYIEKKSITNEDSFLLNIKKIKKIN